MQFGSKEKVGLSLMELVVVIAMITALAAILLPVFAEALATAEQDTCLSNIKKLTAGCRMYIQEWDDYLPMCEHLMDMDPSAPATYANHYWGQQIYPYVKNLQLFMCPNDPHSTYPVLDDTDDVCTKESRPNYDYYCFFRNYGISYGYNRLLGCIHEPDGDNIRITQAQVKVPAQTIMIADAAKDTRLVAEHECGSAPKLWDYGACQPRGWKCTGMSSPHNRGANESFVDGHAKWMAFPQNREDVIWDPDRETPGGCIKLP